MFSLVSAMVMLLAGAVGAPAAEDPGVVLAEPTELTFYAYDYDSNGHIMGREGVACQALGSNGITALGRTDHQGHLTVKYSDLFRQEYMVLLFCAPGDDIKCSAIRLDVPHLRGFAEYNVRVTQPEIICVDRVREPRKRRR